MRSCNKCGTEKPLTEYHRDKNASKGRSRRCKECAKSHVRNWTKDNPHKKTAARKAYYSQPDAIEAKRRYDRDYRASNLEKKRKDDRQYAARNSARAVDRVRQWRIENPEQNAAMKRRGTATRRAKIKRACPPWADHAKIKEIYELADKLTRETGMPHDVDHIIPVAGRLVCGLHVHTNLRAIPASENRKKSYKEIEYADGQEIPWLFKVGAN